MANVAWIKIMTDIFDNDKIRLIERLPDADTILVIWFKILCQAGKSNEGGCLMLTHKKPLSVDMLAVLFNRPYQVLQNALNIFQEYGMIQKSGDIWQVSNWQKYQNVAGLDKIREQTRGRVAAYRERKNNSLGDSCVPISGNSVACNDSNVTSNASVTQCNDIDKEIEKEKKDRNRKYEAQRKEDNSIDPGTDLNFENPKLKKAVDDFVEFRKNAKKPMTANAIKLLMDSLSKLSSDTNVQIDILNQSTLNGWTSLYPLRQKQNNQNKRSEVERIVDL